MIRVIHIDDDPEDLELTKLQLNRLDSEIDIVGFTSAKSVAVLDNLEIQYDCILSDYQMPELDGLELLKIIRNKEIHLPFVFLTGQGNEDLAAEALRTGANDYYTKDVGFAHYQRMLNSIRNLVNARREVIQSKEIEKKLRSIVKEKETILGNMQEMVVYYNNNYEIIWANQSANESFEKAPDKLKGSKCCHLWHPEINKCDNCPLDRALKTGETHEGERSLADGRILWIRGIPIRNDSDEIIGVFESTIDITNRKKAEKELRESEEFLESMFNSIGDAIITTDIAGMINRMNPVAEKLTGWSFEEAKYLPLSKVFKVFVPESWEMVHDPFRSILSNGKDYTPKNGKVLKSKSGENHFISYNGDIIKDSKGDAKGVAVVFRDQTEEFMVKNALKKNERKFKSLFNHMHDGLAIHEFERDVLGEPVNYKLTDVNHKFEQIFNIDKDRSIGKRATEIYRVEKAPYLDIYSSVESTGKPAVFETYHPKLEKHLRIGAFSHEQGKFVTVISDINKEKKIELELKNRVHELAKRIKELNCLYKMQQLLSDHERKLDEVLQDVANLISSAFQNPEALCVLIDIDGMKVSTKCSERSEWRMKSDILSSGKKRGFIEVYYCGDRPRVLEDPFFVEEKYLLESIAQQFSIFLERIEVSKAAFNSKLQYESLFENNHTVILIVDPQSAEIVDANPAACDFYGYGKSQLTSMRVYDINESSKESVNSELNKAKSDEKQLFYLKHKLASGELKDVEVYSGPINLNGRTLLYLIVHDITTRKEIENVLKQQHDDLTQANKELESFSYSVSHDLNAPIFKIINYAQLLNDDYAQNLDGNGLRFLQKITHECEKMHQLISKMLEFSRLKTIEEVSIQVNLSKIAQAVSLDLKKSNEETNAEFTIQKDLRDAGDADLLRIALENLFGNALKYSQNRKKANIKFGTTNKFNGKKRVYFVSDNGIGFDPASADDLFVPFKRLHSKKDFEGSGIGLAIVRRIIQRNGGSIWAESKPNKGSTFYFTLNE